MVHNYIHHGYYLVGLKIIDSNGCSQEIAKSVAIGKGYNLTFPTVFTPNDDQFNDYFRPVQNGFVKAELHIYNSNGQFLYREVVEQTHNLDPLELQGWDGTTQTDERYYIYSFIGTLPSGKTVDRSGTFILLR